MMILRGVILGMVGALGFVTGCDLLAPGDPPAPYFDATIQGAIEADFEGSGKVSWGGLGGVYSFKLDAFSEDLSQYFKFSIYQRSRGAPSGSHAVTHQPQLYLIGPGQDEADFIDGWVAGRYDTGYGTSWGEGPTEEYVAESGTIEITRSWHADYRSYLKDRGDGWIEGRFSISAVRYCGGIPDVDYYCVRLSELPSQMSAHLPRIQVTGSFVARMENYTRCCPDSP